MLEELIGLFGKLEITMFEGDGGDDGGGDDDKGDDDKGGGDDKTFTQADINTALAKQKRDNQKANQEIVDELEAIKSKADLTKQERDDLDARIKKMKTANMTKDELAKQDRLKADNEHTEALSEVTKSRDTWKGRYTQETIDRSIIDAAVGNDALVPEQIIAILQSKTQLEEVQDAEGNKTGNYVPKVDFEVTDDEGKTKTLKLTVPEAVKKMREIGKYQNLFKIEGSGGLNQFNKPGSSGTGQIDVKKISRDPAAYRKAREEKKI
ncbi:MAG: hypothetical protein KAS32_22725 [Candidatus Peribacteraceae bacterium]|nr:hypothetical protein [Candidatus Peribacteraceae bacterium]